MTAGETVRVDEAAASFEDFGDEIIIIDNRTGVFFSLRGRSMAVWRSCLSGMSLTDFGAFAGSLPAEEQAILMSMLSDLRAAEILVSGAEREVESAIAGATELGPAGFDRHEDMDDLIKLDPIHDVDDRGWPPKNAKIDRA